MTEYIEREKLPQKKERGFFMDDDFNAGWNACLNNIKDIPAVDVRPVVRGRWIEFETDTPPKRNECSRCGYITNPWLAHVYNFCPNCGADMREDNDEI